MEVAPDETQKQLKSCASSALRRLKNNGGKKAAIQQILDNKYLEPFQADKRKVIGLGIELDEEGKGLLDWGITEE